MPVFFFDKRQELQVSSTAEGVVTSLADTCECSSVYRALHASVCVLGICVYSMLRQTPPHLNIQAKEMRIPFYLKHGDSLSVL